MAPLLAPFWSVSVLPAGSGTLTVGRTLILGAAALLFLAYLRADVQLAQPTAFVVDTGVRA